MRLVAAASLSLVVAGCSSGYHESCSPQILYHENVSGDATGCVLVLRNGNASFPIAIGDAPACLDPSAPPGNLVAVDCQGPMSGLTCMRSSCQVGQVNVVGTDAAANATMVSLNVDPKSPMLVDAVLICDGKELSTQSIGLQMCAM